MKWRKAILILLMLATLFSISLRPLCSFDIWWHLGIGRHMLTTHSFPTKDIFSHTAQGFKWDNWEWAFGIVVYLIHNLAGIKGILIFKTVLIMVTFWLLFLLITKYSFNIWLSVVLTIWAAEVARPAFTERPWLFTFLFLPTFLLLIHNYIKEDKKLFYLLPFFTLIWGNFHPSAHLGLILLFIYIVGGLCPSPNSIWRNKKEKFHTILLVAALCVVAFFINPGFHIRLLTPFAIIFKQNIGILQEFKPPWFFPLKAYFVLLGVSIITLICRIKHTSIEEILIIITFGILSMMWARNTPLFAICVMPILANHFYKWIKTLLQRYEPLLEGITVVFCVFLIYSSLSGGISRLLEIEQHYPVQAADFIEENHLSGNMYNYYDWGGYLIWRLYPKYKVFIDGRWAPYTEKICSDYITIQKGNSGWEDLLAKYDVNFVVMSTHPMWYNFINALEQSPNWELVYEDALSKIYLKNTKENKSIIDKTLHAQKAMEYYQLSKYDEAINEYKKVLAISPDDEDAHFNLGIIYGPIKKDYDKAIDEFKVVISINPGNIAAYSNIGTAYYFKGVPDSAKKYWEKALHISPNNAEIKEKLRLL